MDDIAIIKARVEGITRLPLADRDAIPHKQFMELMQEFKDLMKRWKELDADNSGNAAGNA